MRFKKTTSHPIVKDQERRAEFAKTTCEETPEETNWENATPLREYSIKGLIWLFSFSDFFWRREAKPLLSSPCVLRNMFGQIDQAQSQKSSMNLCYFY